MLFVLFRYIFLGTAFCYFNDNFADFLEENYGQNFKNILQRSDLGEKGSFGGKITSDEEITNDPIIFVHGVSDTAGEKIKVHAARFRETGYKGSELYATTYADGSKMNPLQWTQYSIKCDYVKQVRALILAVRYYARRDVDVVAFSLGVPIARKAILGGFCVDTNEDLGAPLSRYVDTFVGISGPNHGIAFRVAGVSIPGCALGTFPICDKVIGLYSGLCPMESDFLNDINRKHHYEGKYVYSIYSHLDQIIGYKVCGKVTASIDGEDGHRSFKNLNHDEVLDRTHHLQINLIRNHIIRDGAFEVQIRSNSGASAKVTTRENVSSSRIQAIPDFTTSKPNITTIKGDHSEIYENTTAFVEDRNLLTTENQRENGSKINISTDPRELNKIFLEESHEENMKKIRQFFREQKYFGRNRSNNGIVRSRMESQDDNQDISEINRAQNDKFINKQKGNGYHTRFLFKLQ